ncbi:MAG: alkaline phosphatase family protein [Myxococcales bacterium]|nr:alkaline phosphatase family protein [Myxococcales bacterium]
MSGDDLPRDSGISRRRLLAGAAAGVVAVTGLAAGGGALAAPGDKKAKPQPKKGGAKGKPRPGKDTPIERLAFGACLYNSARGQILDVIREARPDFMLWMGDNIYADTEDMAEMARKYAVLGDNPRFRKLWKACPSMAMWDDHDFGKNNAGREYARKKESKQLFLDFWKVRRTDIRRRRDGIYIARTFGPPGKDLQLILLDGRTFRTSRYAGRKGRGTMLGDAQWGWLERTLREPATIRLLCSGIQVVNTDYDRWESWGDFPHERERLFRTIREARAEGVVILSGDMHHAELSRDPGALGGYDAWDLTAAGLDQHEKEQWANARRVGDVYNEPGGKFGMVRFDWGDDPTVHLEVRDRKGEVVIAKSLARSELRQ